MRTENDLRSALTYRADQAPEPSLALLERARTTKPRPRTKGFVTLGLAVAVVAALIAVPFALIGHRSNSSNSPTDRPITNTDPLSWVSIDTSLLYNLSGTVGSGKEQIEVYLPGIGDATLNDYAPGRFDPAQLTQRVAATVDGHAGYFGQFGPYPYPVQPGQASPNPSQKLAINPPRPTLAWPVAADQWVVLFPGASGIKWNEAKLQSIASTLKVQPRTTPVRLPFRLNYLPAGWSLDGASVGNNNGRGPGLTAAITLRHESSPVIGVDLSGSAPDTSLSGVLDRKVGRYWLELDVDGSDGALTSQQGQRILDSAMIASNPDTENDSWFPVSSIVP